MKPTTISFPDRHAFAILQGWVKEGGVDAAIEYAPLDMANDSGDAIPEGSAVYVADDGSIVLAEDTHDTRRIGIALDDIDDGDSGPVQFIGPVDLAIVGSAVTQGDYGKVSSTPGQLEVATDPSEAFLFFTTTGDEPEAWLLASGGGGGGGGFTEADARDIFVLKADGGKEDVASLGNLGATETLDLANGNWQRGTLNADCTLSFTGATNGKGCSFTLFLTEDGTGGWTPTFPGSVVWIGGTTPTHDTTAGSVSVYAFMSYDGGTTWYGLQAGGGSASSGGHFRPLTTFDPDLSKWLVLVDGDGNVIDAEV